MTKEEVENLKVKEGDEVEIIDDKEEPSDAEAVVEAAE